MSLRDKVKIAVETSADSNWMGTVITVPLKRAKRQASIKLAISASALEGRWVASPMVMRPSGGISMDTLYTHEDCLAMALAFMDAARLIKEAQG